MARKSSQEATLTSPAYLPTRTNTLSFVPLDNLIDRHKAKKAIQGTRSELTSFHTYTQFSNKPLRYGPNRLE